MRNLIPWYSNHFSPDVSRRIAELFEARSVSMGKECEVLENTLATYHEVGHCKTFSSGSAALLAVAHAVTEPSDHVILQARTWIATAHAFHLAGCDVSICDMDLADGISTVSHLRGHQSNMGQLWSHT